jgi:tetratricopeptide (TPR) repeat protein
MRLPIVDVPGSGRLRDPINLALSVVVFLVAFVTYMVTKAPTIPFWDCGEFIACSKILGVPHPPGTPLFILLGRVFILIPLFQDVSVRVNFLSVLTSSLAVWLTYLFIVRVVLKWFKDPGRASSRIVAYAGGLVGGLIVTFSDTFWFNATEAEVYGLSMLMIVLICHLALSWSERKDDPGSRKLLLLVTYLAFMALGIHMTAFLVMPGVFLFVILTDGSLRRDWSFWVVSVILFLVTSAVMPFLIALAAGLFVFGAASILSREASRRYGFVLGLLVAATIGYTTHLYIPIRASLAPAINENDPQTWDSFNDFLERKQYGEKSMLEKMFERRGSWKHQFGDYHNLGFWYYFKRQYGSPNWRPLVLLLGLLGIVGSLIKSPKIGTMLLVLLLICTVGLVLYMNFSDGTKGERMEVRDRDYFYSPGFMLFGLLIGLGVSALLYWFTERALKTNRPAVKTALAAVLGLLFVALPALNTSAYHFRSHDRRGDVVPYDYAYNILNSCEKDGIIFTNGDNDTFPLWCLQEAYGVRKDVRVVNLSLLNTDWYILQLKHQMEVPVDLDDDQIRWVKMKDAQGNDMPRPEKPFYDKVRGFSHYLVPMRWKDGVYVRLAEQMIEQIIMANNWRCPVYFSVTVPGPARGTAGKYLRAHAMALKVVPQETAPGEMDIQRTRQLLLETYRYGSLDQVEVTKNENVVGLATVYPERFLELAKAYRDSGEDENAVETMKAAIKLIPLYHQHYINLADYYRTSGDTTAADSVLNSGVEKTKEFLEVNPSSVLSRQFLALLYYHLRDFPLATRTLEEAYKIDPHTRMTVRLLSDFYLITSKPEQAVEVLSEWTREHPEDTEGQELLNNLLRRQTRIRED